MELTANVHREDGAYWADVPELPGCFAAGDTLDELFNSLMEGIRIYLDDSDRQSNGAGSLRISSAVLSDTSA